MDEETKKILDDFKKEEDPFKKASNLHYLKINKKIRIKDLSESLDLKAAYVCHLLRLLKLPEIIRDGYYTKTVSLSHLFIVARLKSHEDMIVAYEKILSENMTAVQTEGLVREMLYDVKIGGDYVAKNVIVELNDALNLLGHTYSAKIIQTRVRGRVSIEVKGGLEETTPALLAFVRKIKG